MRPTLTKPALRRIVALAGGTAMTVGAALIPAAPALAASSTTVAPAGHSYTASLNAGTASFTVGSVSVNCNQSSTSGAVPAAPGNANGAGPVTGPITAPTFTNNGAAACPTNVLFTTATSTTSGNWTISLQNDPAGSTGTLTIPQGGVVTKTAGLASCTITVAPNGPADVVGSWTNGTPSLLTINTTVPISVSSGFGCPSNSTAATFKATYRIDDTTDSASAISVTE